MRGTRKAQAQRTQSSAVRGTVLGLSFAHPRTSDPDGREVVFDVGSRLHLGERCPWLLDHIDVILDTVARPDYRVVDPSRTASGSIASTSSPVAGCGSS